MIRLNESAPDFTANSTHGPIQLSDYRGKWVVLFSHPADFTPVCTSEFVAFAKRAPEFEQIGCSLMGLSVDSVYAHIAWIRNIEERFAVKINFPIIEDLSMQIASLYGMIQPAASHTSTVRSLFVIDDQGHLRAILTYPMTTGRSVSEVLRLVRALQSADKNEAATPEGWQPGDPMILSAPSTVADAETRAQKAQAAGWDCVDWYFCRKSLPTDKAKQKKAA
ncbi:MAG: peroxiredoxin [Bdellovibrionales bacterium]|nr:peroxiredoxin [Bdellovibrionales bacterium]